MQSVGFEGMHNQPLTLYDIIGGLFVFALPFSIFWLLSDSVAPEIIPIYGAYGFYLTDIPLALLLIIAGISFWKNRHPVRTARSRSDRLFVIILLLIPLLGFATAHWAINPGLALYSAIRWTFAIGIFFAWQAPDFNIRRLTWVFLIGLGLHAAIGIAQVVVKAPLGLPGELALSVDRPRAAVLWLQGSAWLRAYGLTFHPNVLGGFLATGLILGLPLVSRWTGRIVWWLMAAGLMATFSRSAWLAAALVLLPLIVWLYRKEPKLRKSLKITIGAVLAVGLLSLVVLFKPIVSRFDVFSSLSEYTSLSGRGELLNLALQSIRQHPLTGIGAGNFPLQALNSGSHDAAHSVHHVPLLLGSEVGAVGVLLWYVLWLAPVLTMGKFLNNETNLVLVGAWFAMGLISLWDSYPWSLEVGRLLTATLLGGIFRQKNIAFIKSEHTMVSLSPNESS